MKITIELSDKQERFLRQFAENQTPGEHDNLGTHKPLHLVQTQDFLTVYGHHDNGDQIWIKDGETYNSLYEVILACARIEPLPYEEALYQEINGVYVEDESSYCKVYGVDYNTVSPVTEFERYRTVAYFWTLAEAKRYKEYQRHNLRKPRTYTVAGGYANEGDYEPFWDLLMTAGRQVIDLKNKGMHVLPGFYAEI